MALRGGCLRQGGQLPGMGGQYLLNKHIMDNQKNIALSKSFNFSLKIMEFSEELVSKRHFIISDQILKSGTSVGANIWEAQDAESKLDFIHKLKISAKEAKETEYWLLLCKNSANYPETTELLILIKELQKIISKIIITCKSK